jgi:hypothetical protein
MARRLPTKMRVILTTSEAQTMLLIPIHHPLPLMPGERNGVATIVWEKPAKKKARR